MHAAVILSNLIYYSLNSKSYHPTSRFFQYILSFISKVVDFDEEFYTKTRADFHN